MNPNEKVRMTIIINDEGKTFVTGPLDNKNMCYHMLLDAFLIVMDFKSDNKIVLAQPAVIPVKSN